MSRFCRMPLALALVALGLAAFAQEVELPPTPRIEVREELHGRELVDPRELGRICEALASGIAADLD